MNKIVTLIRKEVLDILRDKKTLIMMVAVPVLLYPAMIIGMVLIMGMVANMQQETIHTAAYSKEYEEQAAILKEIYEERTGVQIEKIIPKDYKEINRQSDVFFVCPYCIFVI